MRNLRVAVDNAADQTEARNIMISLGYLPKEITCISGGDLGFVVNAHNENGATYKEITLPQLRDLVVLKRNDVRDATHTDGHYSFYVGKDKNYFFSSCDKAWRGTWKNVEILKPIEKPMKEYLRKNSNGTYSYIGTVQPENVSDFMIEIPEWAVAYADHKNGHGFFYDSFCKIASFYNIVWSRHTHPEELPFIDDESYNPDYDGSEKEELESLNDQYAEIETVRQSAWAKQEGGSHYKNLKIQPMQYALENKLDYAQANVIKYVTRHADKNGKEDLLKAIHNLELMIEFYYGDEK